jgi:hydrogenase maturation protease
MARTLVIGYGNPSRQDDGAGLAVVNDLRGRLGLPALEEGDDGGADLGAGLDTLFLQLLSPELAETLAGYDHVAFVDAHTGAIQELVHRTPLEPRPGASMASHHMKPSQLLALTVQLYGRAPTSELISIRGYDFDFGSTLSPATQEGVRAVAGDIWRRHGPGD